MRNPRSWRWLVLAAALALALAGCGDSNLFDGDSSGREADMEAGVAALDAGNWQKAREIFAGMDQNDPDVRKYHASTYLAEAGFNAIELLRELAKAGDDDSGSGDNSGNELYEAITGMFDDGDGVLTAGELGYRLDAIAEAIRILGDDTLVGRLGARAASSAADDELVFQRGLFAAVYAVLSVVEQLEYTDATGTYYLLSLDALREHREVIDAVIVPDFFNEALAMVRAAADVLVAGWVPDDPEADGSDVAEALDDFLGPNPDGIGYLDANGEVDVHSVNPEVKGVIASELQTYLKKIAGLPLD